MVTNFSCVRKELKSYLETNPLESWLKSRLPQGFEPFYASIDIRDAEYKLAPVDANLYPAGFNNICSEDLESSVEILRPLLIRHFGKIPKKIGILPELHTRNPFYVDNLYELRQIFRRLGCETEIGWWDPKMYQKHFVLHTSDHRELSVYPFWKVDRKLHFLPFEPEFILLNNDFSSGYPPELLELEQPLEPSPQLGWHTRKKSDFFENYNTLAQELAEKAGLDPWHLQIQTKLVSNISFEEKKGLEQVAEAAELILGQMRKQYEMRKLSEEPSVFIKSNSGTYGMGILKIESGEKLLNLNRRERNKMAVGKNHLVTHEVIIQEGIPTRFKIDGVYAEPVIYLLGQNLMGGFLRKNPERGRLDNLNSKGMVFEKLCISDLRNSVERDLELELVYGTIAQLSCAAMTLEIEKLLTPSRKKNYLGSAHEERSM